MDKITWYVARSSGIVAWALILTTIVWGLLLATRCSDAGRPRRGC